MTYRVRITSLTACRPDVMNSQRMSRILTAALVALLPVSLPAMAQGKPKAAAKAAAPEQPVPMQALGSRVLMDLPKSFSPAPRFVGFFDQERQMSFVVSDFPSDAYPKLTASFTPALLAERGFLDSRLGKLERTDAHTYIRAAQKSPAGLTQKFMLIFADATNTVMIAANVPTPLLDSGAVKERDIETMLVSARLAASKKEMPPIASLSDTGSLKSALIYGQTMMWTVDGKTGSGAMSSPSIIVAASINYDIVANPMQTAVAGINALASHRNIAFIGKPQASTIGPHKGVEISATAESESTGDRRGVFQFLIPLETGGYVRFIGIAPLAEKDLWFVTFRQSIKTMRLRE
jgi:hypothetical protein